MNYTVTQAQIDRLNATLSFALEQVAAITGQPVQPPVEPPKPVDPPVQPQEGVYPPARCRRKADRWRTACPE